MKSLHFLLFSLMLLLCPGCDLLKELNQDDDAKLFFKVTVNSKTNHVDTILFTGKEIKWFNDSTGEIIFTDTVTTSKIKYVYRIKCYLGTDSLFTATVTSDIMSSIVNDLVLNHNLYDGKYYFEDGYPGWINNLGATTLRVQNKEKRAVAWKRFIEQLKKEGKIKR